MGGDVLTYEFSADPATYTLWVRVWTDDLDSPGADAFQLVRRQDINVARD